MSKPEKRFNFSDIQPDQPGATPSDAAIDQAGERAGFVSREPLERIYKQERSKEPTTPLSMRPTVSVANRFITWCKRERYSYPEGLAELMRRAGIDGTRPPN
ncbi:hypothetical protein [Aurantimonas phage AmM-1]|uniref:hypothetical protein n=1 Tax=Aurantimonas phage AmM-1 TaxID=1503929 RepID=UPI0005410099|nr:hypothetical protein ACQ23_gp34 [Aurantimonas phage AmM-1]BAP94491.1 hypothetical protein [Aurantimonas phage AmM-1]